MLYSAESNPNIFHGSRSNEDILVQRFKKIHSSIKRFKKVHEQTLGEQNTSFSASPVGSENSDKWGALLVPTFTTSLSLGPDGKESPEYTPLSAAPKPCYLPLRGSP